MSDINIHAIRTTYRTRDATRSCQNCRFASVKVVPGGYREVMWTTFAGREAKYEQLPPTYIVHCHRHPPQSPPGRPTDWVFPKMTGNEVCDEWQARIEGEERTGEKGDLVCKMCMTCKSFSGASPHGSCRRKPPEITHEGNPRWPEVGPQHWCGDHQLDEGVGREDFSGRTTGSRWLDNLREQARKPS